MLARPPELGRLGSLGFRALAVEGLGFRVLGFWGLRFRVKGIYEGDLELQGSRVFIISSGLPEGLLKEFCKGSIGGWGFRAGEKLAHPPLLKGSWDLVTRVITKVTILIITYNPN